MIVAKAHQRLAAKLSYSTIALQFMPERFTLSQLQRVYELVLGEKLDKRNFRKRILALDCIEDSGDLLRNAKHRPPSCIEPAPRSGRDHPLISVGGATKYEYR